MCELVESGSGDKMSEELSQVSDESLLEINQEFEGMGIPIQDLNQVQKMIKTLKRVELHLLNGKSLPVQGKINQPQTNVEEELKNFNENSWLTNNGVEGVEEDETYLSPQFLDIRFKLLNSYKSAIVEDKMKAVNAEAEAYRRRSSYTVTSNDPSIGQGGKFGTVTRRLTFEMKGPEESPPSPIAHPHHGTFVRRSRNLHLDLQEGGGDFDSRTYTRPKKGRVSVKTMEENGGTSSSSPDRPVTRNSSFLVERRLNRTFTNEEDSSSDSNSSLQNNSMEEIESMARRQELALRDVGPSARLLRRVTQTISVAPSYEVDSALSTTIASSEPGSQGSSGLSSPRHAESYDRINSNGVGRSMPNLTRIGRPYPSSAHSVADLKYSGSNLPNVVATNHHRPLERFGRLPLRRQRTFTIANWMRPPIILPNFPWPVVSKIPKKIDIPKTPQEVRTSRLTVPSGGSARNLSTLPRPSTQPQMGTRNQSGLTRIPAPGTRNRNGRGTSMGGSGKTVWRDNFNY